MVEKSQDVSIHTTAALSFEPLKGKERVLNKLSATRIEAKGWLGLSYQWQVSSYFLWKLAGKDLPLLCHQPHQSTCSFHQRKLFVFPKLIWNKLQKYIEKLLKKKYFSLAEKNESEIKNMDAFTLKFN